VGVLRIAPDTGDRTLIAASGPGDGPEAIGVAADDGIWVVDSTLAALLLVDEVNKVLNVVHDTVDPNPATSPWDFSFPVDFAFDTSGVNFEVLDASECSAIVEVDGSQPGPGDHLLIDLLTNTVPEPCFGRALTVGPGSEIYYLDDDSPGKTLLLLVAGGLDTVVSGIDPRSGGTIGAGAPTFVGAEDVAVEPDGQILVIDYDGFSFATLLRVDPTTGDRTPLSGTGPTLLAPQAVAVDSQTGRIFVVAGVFDGSGTCLAGVWQVDPVTGDRALLSASPASNFFGYCGSGG